MIMANNNDVSSTDSSDSTIGSKMPRKGAIDRDDRSIHPLREAGLRVGAEQAQQERQEQQDQVEDDPHVHDPEQDLGDLPDRQPDVTGSHADQSSLSVSVGGGRLVAEVHPERDQVLEVSERCPITTPPASRTASRSGIAQRCSIASTSAELPSGRSSSSPPPPPRLRWEHRHRRCAERRAEHGALGAGDAEADEGTDRGAQLGPLVVVEIRHAQERDVVALAHHEHGVDDPDLADIAQARELVGDASFEQLVVGEADHERLDGSDGHVAHLTWSGQRLRLGLLELVLGDHTLVAELGELGDLVGGTAAAG